MQQFLKDVRPLLYGKPVMYFDVGAYKGAVFTEVAAADWGTFLEAHLIEPNPDSFPALQQAATAAEEAKRAKQAHCHNVAVGSAKGSLQFRSEGTRTRVIEKSEHFDSSNKEEYFEIKASTLDEIAETWGVKHISILKIDVEGHEGEVLKGAKNLLEAHAVDILYVEAGIDPNNEQQYYYRALEDALVPLRYRLFRIYEQKNEWLTDSPFLRRVNLAFMSETFATQTPFQLSKKHFDLQKKYNQLESELAAATENATKTSAEHLTERKSLETQLAGVEEQCAALQESARQAEEAGKQKAEEFAARLAEQEKALAAETARLRAAEDDGRKKAADLAAKLADKDAEEQTRRQQLEESEARLRELTEQLAVATNERSLLEEAHKAECAAIKKKISEGEARAAKLAGELQASKAAISEKNKEAELHRAAVQQYQEEVADLRSKMQSESLILQARAAASESSALATKQTISFQLGGSILDAFKSPAKALSLPSTLWNLHKDAGTRLSHKAMRQDLAERGPRFQAMLKLLQDSGCPALREYFASLRLSVASQVDALSALSKEIRSSHLPLAIEAASEAQRLDPKPYRAKWIAFRLADNGDFEKSAAILLSYAAEADFSEPEAKRAKQIISKSSKSTPSRPSSPAKVPPSSQEQPASASPAQTPSPGILLNSRGQAFTAAELGEKIWTGYANYAVPTLELMKSDTRLLPGDRAIAAWHLGSWYFVEHNFSQALENASYIQFVSDDNSLKTQGRLLEARALLQLARPAEALRVLEDAFAATRKVDFQLLKSTAVRQLLLSKGEPIDRVDAAQLAEINELYHAAGLAPILKKDAGAPLSFANICAPAEPKPGPQDSKVSVIIPAYNAQDSIAVAIESLLAQTWRNLEILVVDDCSTDATADVVADLAKSDPRVRLIRKTKNEGAYPARNTALEHITGEIVTVHDSDDWSHSQKIEVQLEALFSNKNRVATLSHWVRVGMDLEVVGGWVPKNTIFDLNLSSLLFRTKLFERLHRWDNVRVSGDSEFYSRLKALMIDDQRKKEGGKSGSFQNAKFPKDAIRKIPPSQLLALSLARADSLTHQKSTHLRSLRYGIRWQYQDAYLYAHGNIPHLKECEQAGRRPFPIPIGNLSKTSGGGQYDVVVIADFAMDGGAFVSSLNYVIAACKAGKKVAVLHWRKFGLSAAPQLQRRFYDACMKLGFDILSPGDSVAADLVIFGYPVILQYKIAPLPTIAAKRIVVIVNQFASRLADGGDVQYDPLTARANLKSIFGQEAVWIPISNWVARLMGSDPRYAPVHPQPWHPMIDAEVWCAQPLRWRGGDNRLPVVGRHGRDAYTKWPASAEALAQAYGAGKPWPVRFLGGADIAIRLLGEKPANWTILPFDAIETRKFLEDLDFYVHYPLEDYIEEFGRGVMEAMAAGLPVILPPQFRETFGDAALYAPPEEVCEVISRLWANQEDYLERARIGREFVLEQCDIRQFQARLDALAGSGDSLNGTLPAIQNGTAAAKELTTV